ncbi:uncharacterized protein LOC133324730 [Musca vetustissima]|uniref:uncharacterized protein LOC133324730 n=1 Tax=Musca vetustissima TaxID=27455 RepID=UPI002AB75239|nr:uncharacterized protein LOC133324730 [Musca vetustissima]
MLLQVMVIVFITAFISLKLVTTLTCKENHIDLRYNFYLLKSSHRSLADKLHVENVESVELCKQITRQYKGLAFNYNTKENYSNKGTITGNISRDHYWEQPQLYFNCHILKCPEGVSSKTLISDRSFDYYSLYEKLIVAKNYICIPEVGLFTLNTEPETFENATLKCRKQNADEFTTGCGSLAHIASETRTTALTQILLEHNQKQEEINLKSKINLAYVGLSFNRTRGQRFEMFNMDDDSLKCFAYRAWEPGNPKMSSNLRNTSCVALSSHSTWLTVDCKRKLPYFCEILTKCGEEKDGWEESNVEVN